MLLSSLDPYIPFANDTYDGTIHQSLIGIQEQHHRQRQAVFQSLSTSSTSWLKEARQAQNTRAKKEEILQQLIQLATALQASTTCSHLHVSRAYEVL